MRLGLWIATLLLFSACQSASAAAPLFHPLSIESAEDLAPPVLRSRTAQVQFSALNGDAQTPTVGAAFTLNLFEDLQLACVVTETTPSKGGGWIVNARIEPPSSGNATLTMKEGVLVGAVYLGPIQYRIRYLGDGAHRIEEINPSQFPPDSAPIPAP
ncbi:MAG: hypothetical protein G3M78_04710 [Candidatus Nitrohelix vancouverensis]|uniref:Lipoprotein n=1 Tax=Candidatus Nitrohelix vancouverensis TaxID=2705534 RepID=A0A7T0C1C4_9BACT|nr:MAG: hypothetical protein G3M78_04710 [Candidatus Nitrohelix vancouverensis]